MKTLLVIDMQNDFIDGSLGTKEAVAIVDKVKAKIEEYRANGDRVIFTRDTHHERRKASACGTLHRRYGRLADKGRPCF